MSLPTFQLIDGHGEAGAMLHDVRAAVGWMLREGREDAPTRASLERIETALHEARADAERGLMVAEVEHDDLHALEFVLTLILTEDALRPYPGYFLQWLNSTLARIEERRGVSAVEHLGKIDA